MFKWFHRRKDNHSNHLSEFKERLVMQELASLDIEAIKQFALKDWELGETHGLSHWQRVERNGIILATSILTFPQRSQFPSSFWKSQ